MAKIPLEAFLDQNESKTMLNTMNQRINDMDLKLSLILELLATRLPDQSTHSTFPSPPQTVISEASPQSITPSATNSTLDKTTSSLTSSFQTDGALDMEGEEDTKELFENESQPSQTNQSPKDTEVEDEKLLADAPFPKGAVKRAAEKAARSSQSTQPKVFAWHILRESVTDDELRNVQISLRTYHRETAEHLLGRQLPKIRLVVETTMKYFKWDLLSTESQLSKTKLILGHLQNNVKVRNWTLGRSNRDAHANSPVDADLVWERYLALLGCADFALCNGGTQSPSIP